MKALIYVLLIAGGCACTPPKAPESPKFDADELTCLAEQEAIASKKIVDCKGSVEGDCSTDAIVDAQDKAEKEKCIK